MDIPVTKVRWRDERLPRAEAVLAVPTAILPGGNCWLPTAELKVRVASTTYHPGTIFQLTHRALDTNPRLFSSGITLRADTELRAYFRAQVFVNNSASLLHLSARTWAERPTPGTNCSYWQPTQAHLLPHDHQCQSETSEAWSLFKPAHLNTVQEHEEGNIMATLIIYTGHNQQRGQTFLLNTDRCWSPEASEKPLACT